MKTINNSEFAAHTEMYLDLAREQDICIRKGQEMFYIIYAPDNDTPQTILAPDDDLRRALPANEFRKRLEAALDRVDKKYTAK